LKINNNRLTTYCYFFIHLSKLINMEKKQTAVEWVIQYLSNVKPNEFCSIEKIKELLQQAKKMEKEQILKAYEKGYDDVNVYEPEKYYNETYKSK
jgi:phosphoribosylaminoimidazole carboxylase (NCAIR synthetase)